MKKKGIKKKEITDIWSCFAATFFFRYVSIESIVKSNCDRSDDCGSKD